MVSVLAGCNIKEKALTNDLEASTPVTLQDNTIESTEKAIKYLTEDNQVFILKTNDNFTTATLEDNQGNNYALKNAGAANGILLKGENGVAIHTQGQEGFIELANNKVLKIKENQ